jgi:AraC family transcriptional regulator
MQDSRVRETSRAATHSKRFVGAPQPLRAPSAAGVFGGVPAPILSSAARAWTGLLVELYRVADVEMVKRDADHVVTVFLGNPVDLVQRRYGRVVRRTMNAGDVIVAPAGEPKWLQHRDPAELVKLRLAPSLVAGIVGDLVANGASHLRLLDNFGTRDARIGDLARRLVDEARDDALGGRLYAESLATELVVHLLRHYSTPGRLGNGVATLLPRYKMRRVTDYIDENLREDLTLGEMSATLSMSPYHFAHAFRQTVGLAPHRYVLLRRVEVARRLLRETDLPITEIAHQVGYSSQSSFSVVFHRVTGRSPRNFRNGG